MNLNPDQKYWTGPIKIIIWKILLVFILLPITVQDYFLGEFFNFKEFYTRKADGFIIQMVKDKGLVLMEKLGSPITKSLRDYDFHRIFTHYVYENSKNHQAKLSNYVALYGFLRSLCLITVIFFWFAFLKFLEKIYIDKSLKVLESVDLIYLVLIAISSYLFFMAFMKFYRRYSLEGLMLIVIDENLVDSSKKRKILEE
ncbi:hypothetical protein BKP44_14035 [Formosa algae]|nr:hypothetical protein BKP44_14035 [Formosa algae]